jgi:S1-C subfamily serine protease
VWKATNSSASGSGPLNGSGSTGSGTNGSGTNGSGSNSSGSGSSGSPTNQGSGASGSGSTPSASLSAAVAAISPTLVDINTTLSYQNGEAAGTGIVLSSDGYVLTNNHVISGATSISATDVGNGHTYTARLVGYDRSDDVAMIKLEGASGLATAKIGDSSKVNVGDAVVGIGNAGGAGGSPASATGTVTALGQSITAQDEANGTSEQLTGLIQTNADIQPGDSGGALVSASAEVVGIDTAASTGFSFQTPGNQGFAIPINSALAIAAKIRAGQSTANIHIGATAFLGVEVSTGNSGGLGTTTSGAALSGVLPNGPAAAAGLASGDVITSIGGTQVASANALTAALSAYHPGDKVTIGWTDTSGRSHQATVVLATGPAA